MKEEFDLTAKELARLSDWLKMKGLTDKDFSDCLHYITNTPEGRLEKENQVSPKPSRRKET